MSNEIQKADIWKRIAAWIFDAFLISVLAAVCGLFLSWALYFLPFLTQRYLRGIVVKIT